MNAIITILTQSMLLSIMGIGVFITYRILDFPDMTADGSYTLGAAVTAAVVSSGLPAGIAVLASVAGGAVAGMVSGLLHVKLKITNLLSGILVMGMLYSINLRVMGGKANLPVFDSNHIFNALRIPGVEPGVSVMIISAAVLLTVKISLDLFLKTGAGYLIKGTGDNEQMVKTLGVDVDRIKVMALMISNSIIALSGSMMCQFLGFADVNMGIGTLVLGIASIIIGISLFRKMKFINSTTKIVIGTVLYQSAIFAALNTGLQSSDLKLITGIIIIAFLAAGQNGLRLGLPSAAGKRKLSVSIGKRENINA